MSDKNLKPCNESAPNKLSCDDPRIGLCLSGGGFRASFFHLGTIRYLEEAGIMEKVEVVSTVSGGSIIGAYYLVEMERKLRAQPDLDRLTACDEIIQEFSAVVRKNLRMRALVFYPFLPSGTDSPKVAQVAALGRHDGQGIREAIFLT